MPAPATPSAPAPAPASTPGEPSLRDRLAGGVAWLALLGCVALTVLAVAIGPDDDVAEPGVTQIELWYPWGGDFGDRLKLTVQAFNDAQVVDPATGHVVRVRAVYARETPGSNQKLYLAMAGGVPPDVAFVDGQDVCDWAHAGQLRALDDFLSQAGITADDFWPPSWDQTLWGGRVYALPYSADPNFGFFWNKALFRAAGLDPNRPPRTIAELDDYADRMTIDRGTFYEQIGIRPWYLYNFANALYTWGWVFGGDFYDEDTQTITCDDPRIVRALEWMVSYADRYDVEKLTGAMSGVGTGNQNPLALGRQAMMPMVVQDLDAVRRYAPGTDLGVGPFPYPDDDVWGRGQPNSSWVGGHTLAIPADADEPTAAFTFMRWLCATDEGAGHIVSTTGSFPGYKHAPYTRYILSPEGAAADPMMHRLALILRDATHVRPVLPVQSFYSDQLERTVSDCLYKDITPAEALAQTRVVVQAALDEALARAARDAGGQP